MSNSNGHRADPVSIPYMKDPDGELAGEIEKLWPLGEPGCTPRGRVYANDLDEYHVYREMYQLLTGELRTIKPAVYEQRLADLTEMLNALHEAGVEAFENYQASRWGW